MHLLRKITYVKFSEFIQEKNVYIMYLIWVKGTFVNGPSSKMETDDQKPDLVIKDPINFQV